MAGVCGAIGKNRPICTSSVMYFRAILKKFPLCTETLFFFFFHVAVHAHMVGDLREFILLPKTKDYFKFLHQKKRKDGNIRMPQCA